MKIRNGFVSNSSSSSFLIDATKYSKEKVTEYIESLLVAHNIIENTDLSLEDICFINNTSGSVFFKEVAEFYSANKDLVHRDADKYPDCIVVDSTSDNSIPWNIQDALERIAIKRQHWG